MLWWVLVILKLITVVKAATPSAGACLCVHATHVNVRDKASLSGHVVAQVSNGQCGVYAGYEHVADGYTWYKFTTLHEHQNVWAASNFFNVASASHCSSTTSGEFATGMVSQQCLQCICDHESGCRPLGCHMDGGSPSCGYFQIKESYWLDCGKLGTSWQACADDKICSSQCVQNNMKRYAAHFNCSLTCESYARIHNGGPRGCHYTSTINYWHRLQAQPGCHNV